MQATLKMKSLMVKNSKVKFFIYASFFSDGDSYMFHHLQGIGVLVLLLYVLKSNPGCVGYEQHLQWCKRIKHQMWMQKCNLNQYSFIRNIEHSRGE